MRVPSITTIMAKTEFRDTATARAAQKTLRWLEAGAPHKIAGKVLTFDMGDYVELDISSACGTSCCMAGAIKIFRDGVPEGSLGSWHLMYDFKIKDQYNEGLYRLFYGNFGAKPLQAATTLRHYLSTGEVRW